MGICVLRISPRAQAPVEIFSTVPLSAWAEARGWRHGAAWGAHGCAGHGAWHVYTALLDKWAVRSQSCSLLFHIKPHVKVTVVQIQLMLLRRHDFCWCFDEANNLLLRIRLHKCSENTVPPLIKSSWSQDSSFSHPPKRLSRQKVCKSLFSFKWSLGGQRRMCWKESKSRSFKRSRAARPRPLSYHSCHSHQNTTKLRLLQIKRKSCILYSLTTREHINKKLYKAKSNNHTFIFSLSVLTNWILIIITYDSHYHNIGVYPIFYFFHKLKTNTLKI